MGALGQARCVCLSKHRLGRRMTSSAEKTRWNFLWRQQKTSRLWVMRPHRESSSIRVWSNRRWWLFYQSNADDDDEEEVSLKDFECKTWKSRDAQCLWRRKFSFLFRDLFYFFSGWKFSSSSLLKILLGFRLKLLFFLCNGNCLSTECLGCFRVAFRVGKWQYFRSRVLKIADSHGMKEMINSHQPNKHKSRWWTDLQEIKFTFH